jgi:hypothetical protein
MKISVDTIHRITIDRELCPCRAIQEFHDETMNVAVEDPIFKPCAKHKGRDSKIIKEDLLEFIKNKAGELKKSANEVGVPLEGPTPRNPPPEQRVPVRVGGKSRTGLRRVETQTASSAKELIKAKTAASTLASGNSIDAELAGITTVVDPVLKDKIEREQNLLEHLVESSGGLGLVENDPSLDEYEV